MSMLAPTASFIRLRFDPSVEKFLSSLSDYLANSSAEGNAISTTTTTTTNNNNN